MARGLSDMRAIWADAVDDLAAQDEVQDIAPQFARDGIEPGTWMGAPADSMPPNCPVIPLGTLDKTSFFVDSLGQLISVNASEWSKKMLVQLFALQPNYLYWAWPRWHAKLRTINGLEVDDAMQCLIKQAGERGLFNSMDRVRGRGAWVTKRGDLIWHAGDMLYRVEGKRLIAAKSGEVDGMFYPRRPVVTKPWQEPVPSKGSPVHDLLDGLRSWTWERDDLDPLLVLGWLGCAYLGAALPWRPSLFITGDRGVGKSTLQGLIKSILGDALHACADTTAAGIYQRVGQDSLPVAVDELEAGADNRRVMAVVGLARLAASGALMYRGGADHGGVEFRLQNAFAFSSINPPPLEPADKSRMAIVNLGKFDPARARPLVIKADVVGRQILRALMDGWRVFDDKLKFWKVALSSGGLDSRAQDTYGTLLAVANIMLGDEAMAGAGLDTAKPEACGKYVARYTANERAEMMDNWRGCLEHVLGSTIEAWKGGEKPTVGSIIEEWEEGIHSLDQVNARLLLVGLKGKEETALDGARSMLLCVPLSSVSLQKVFAGSKWASGVWGSALKQAPGDVVIRDRGNGQNVKINRMTARCVYVDLARYDAFVSGEARDGAG